jgi:hypothetical protein
MRIMAGPVHESVRVAAAVTEGGREVDDDTLFVLRGEALSSVRKTCCAVERLWSP